MISRIVYLTISATVCIRKSQRHSQVQSVCLRIYRIRELDSAQGSDDIYGRVIRTARSLYRCSFSCKDAFPLPEMKENLAKFVWNEACAREGANPQQLLYEEKEAGLFFFKWGTD